MTETISRIDEGQPRPKYILINVELTSTFLLYRGLVHQHHRLLNFHLTQEHRSQIQLSTIINK